MDGRGLLCLPRLHILVGDQRHFELLSLGLRLVVQLNRGGEVVLEASGA